MTLQDLGSIGELVGAIAVVVTLVYLARQIRENSRQVRLSSITSINQLINEGFEPIYNNTDYLEIWFAGLESRERLDDFQRNLFDLFMARLMNSFCTALVQYNNDALDEENFRRYVGVYRAIVESEGGRHWMDDIGTAIIGAEATEVLRSGNALPLISPKTFQRTAQSRDASGDR